jgi:glycosyltransferase involved in cell wall biosynthesis
MGGLERNTLTLCLALRDAGHQVRLLTETPSEEPDDYPFPITRTASVPEFVRVLSVTDLLIVNGNVSLRIHPLAGLCQVPYAVVYHNYRGYHRRGNAVATKIGNYMRGVVARRAEANVFTSTYAKDQVSLPEERSHVVLNPVDKKMEQFYNTTLEETRQGRTSPFLFAGRIIEGKGIFVLAEALEYLDGEVETRVVIAGEGRDENELRRRTQHLSTIQVDFVGRLGGEALVRMYQKARALLVPSTTHKEGNPLVVAEALYAGTPVIASDQPPMIESVGEAGIIVEQGKARELARAIRRMQGEDGLYAKVRECAEARGELFGYDHYRERIEGITSALEERI